MEFSVETFIMLLGYAVSIGCMYGALSSKIDALTKKVEKHNNVVERQYHLEGEVDTLKEKMGIYHHE